MTSRYAGYFFITLIVICSCPSLASQKNPWDVKLPFRTAVIEYKISGNENGWETMSIANYGKLTSVRRESAGKVLFISQETNTLTITTPDKLTVVDMEEMSGTEVTNPIKFMIEEYNNLSMKERSTVMENAKKMGASGVSMFHQMGGKFERNAGEHLGYKCDVATFMGTRAFSMAGTPIPLKTQSSILGITMNVFATSVQENVKIKNSVFEVPDGVSIRFDIRADDANREMAKKMIEYLKDPESGKQGKEASRPAPEVGRDGRADEEADEGDGKMDEVQEKMKQGMDAIKGLFD